jgi:hypothetical protein
MDIHHVGKAVDAGDRDDVAQKVETELSERGADGRAGATSSSV